MRRATPTGLRTIRTWAVYSPVTQKILSHHAFKREAKKHKFLECVVVLLEGHYMSKRPKEITKP